MLDPKVFDSYLQVLRTVERRLLQLKPCPLVTELHLLLLLVQLEVRVLQAMTLCCPEELQDMSASLSADVAHSRGLWTSQTVVLMMMQVDRYLHAPLVLTLQLPTSRRRGLRQSLGSFTLADERVEGLHSSEDLGVIFYIHCYRSLCSSGTDVDTK